MSYDKETRQELQEQELREDKIRDFSNEIDDGAFEVCKEQNELSLKKDFLDNNEAEFESYCKDIWGELNTE